MRCMCFDGDSLFFNLFWFKIFEFICVLVCCGGGSSEHNDMIMDYGLC